MHLIHAYTDDKPGHRSQLQGLISALQALGDYPVQWISTPGGLRAGWTAFTHPAQPEPALILCCGSATHLPALVAHWRSRAPVVVLMKPAFPALFDLCVVPEHDGPIASGQILRTQGMLNAQRHRARAPGGSKGLILLGGPSKHYRWDNTDLIQQLQSLFAQLPQYQWTLTTSRRTPEDTLPAIEAMGVAALTLVPWQQTPAGWLMNQLDQADCVWVSEDSASMVYEALSSGASVGVLAVPALKDNKLQRGVEQLAAQGRLTRLKYLVTQGQMQTPSAPLAEAQRVAEHLHQRFFSQG